MEQLDEFHPTEDAMKQIPVATHTRARKTHKHSKDKNHSARKSHHPKTAQGYSNLGHATHNQEQGHAHAKTLKTSSPVLQKRKRNEVAIGKQVQPYNNMFLQPQHTSRQNRGSAQSLQ